MNKMANFSFGWNTHTASFDLVRTKGTYNPCKDSLKFSFRLNNAFQGGF